MAVFRTPVTGQKRSFRMKLSGPELFVIFVLLIAGTFACRWIPLGSGFDEQKHLIRIWEMSALQFIPNDKLAPELPFPAIYSLLSISKQTYGDIVKPDLWAKYAGLPMDAFDYIYGRLDTSVYTPPLLLPQALVMRYLGRRLVLPALPLYYALRLTGLLCYTLLAWLAIRLVPFGKWTFAIIAVSPMAIFQASTITPDSISNGIGLLFIAGCLAIAKREELRWKEWGLLVLLIFLLFLAKINLLFFIFLPFLIFFPSSHFKSQGKYILLVLAALILGLIEVGGWNIIINSRYSGSVYSGAFQVTPGSDPVKQILYVLAHPLNFPLTILSDFWTHALLYLRQWIGIFGYGSWTGPLVVYILYTMGLILSLFSVADDEAPNKKLRLILFTVFILSYIATVSSFYFVFTPVGSQEIIGVVGRYFIPVMPLLFLALIGIQEPKWFHVPKWTAIISIVFSIFCFFSALILSYYVNCGTKFYQLGLCYQPIYKYWTPNASFSPPLSQEMTLTQSFTPTCDGMTEIRVWMDASGSLENERTEFILSDGASHLPIFAQTISNKQLPHQGWYTLDFDPDWHSTGKTYSLTIQTAALQGTLGPRLAYNSVLVNTVSKLTFDGQPVDQNLIYQYGCIAGLEKTWWSISHK